MIIVILVISRVLCYAHTLQHTPHDVRRNTAYILPNSMTIATTAPTPSTMPTTPVNKTVKAKQHNRKQMRYQIENKLP